MAQEIPQTTYPEFFAGEGAMAASMRTHDWASTPLGSPETWPQSLKTTVRILLTSRYAMWMAWGKELTFFCNDAYRPTLGVKSDWALGASAYKVWEEIWPDIGPRIEKVLLTGEATWDEGLLLFLERSGYPEETYHTFSYSPLADDTGAISGMLCVVTEETERIIGERRLALLREVASALASVETAEEVFAAVSHCLGANARDLPFMLAYLFDTEGSAARLVSVSGISPEADIAVSVVGLAPNDTPWPIPALLQGTEPLIIDSLASHFKALPCGPWDKPPEQVIVFPFAQQGQERPAGFLVAAINPYRKFDLEYRDFIGLLVGQLASRLANIRAFEEEKKRAQALTELDRAKTTFFSNVSHEFRTPLTLMLGPVEDILAKPESEVAPDNRALLTVVLRNGQRLLKLVNTLLDFTRIEAGRAQAHYEPTDLSLYTVELASVFRSAIEKAGMRLVVDCPPLSEQAYLDREMWEKIVLNLLSNAFKFTLAGEIAVVLREQAGQALLSVRDTGVGITKEQLPHIFERFHRVEGARARTVEGTGIGLALVQELVKLHGGKVSVESDYGQGTTFTVTLPLGRAHLPPEHISETSMRSAAAARAETFVEEALRWLPDESQAPSQEFSLRPTGVILREEGQTEEKGKARILLADDNADMRDYVHRLLQPHYNVTAVSDGTEALQSAREMRPDLILSDVMMPKLDGFGLITMLRSDPATANIPVILLSARAGEEARIEGLAAGADDYLIKPFSARELLARVTAHLELARVRKEAAQALQASEERVRLASEAAGLGVWVWEPATDGAIWENERMYEIYGLSSVDGPISSTRFMQEIVHPDDAEAYAQAIARPTETGEPLYFVGRFRRVDGMLRWIEFRGRLQPTVSGEPTRIVGTAADITERKEAELALIERAHEIEALNTRLTRAMQETHHRVKNNLQVISAMIEMQIMEHSDEQVVPLEEYRQLKAHLHTLSLVHDLLTNSVREDADGHISSKAVLENLLPMLEKMAWNKSVRYSIEDVRLTSKVCISLALILNELVTNAFKHGKQEAEVIFSIQGTQAALTVSDDGPGFAEGFDPLKAANMGLELVESLVRTDLRGRSVYSNGPGGGGCVRVTFPLPLPLAEE